jgi:hypothetical protein
MMELLKRVFAANNVDLSGKGSQAEQDMASFGNNNSSMSADAFSAKFYRSATDQLFSHKVNQQ